MHMPGVAGGVQPLQLLPCRNKPVLSKWAAFARFNCSGSAASSHTCFSRPLPCLVVQLVPVHVAEQVADLLKRHLVIHR